MVWQGSVVKNTLWVIGIALYTGKSCKMQLNCKKRNDKQIVLNRNIQMYMKFTITLIMTVSLVSLILMNGYSRIFQLNEHIGLDRMGDETIFLMNLVLYLPFVPIVLKDGLLQVVLLAYNYIVN